jgi:hypothetical protein
MVKRQFRHEIVGRKSMEINCVLYYFVIMKDTRCLTDEEEIVFVGLGKTEEDLYTYLIDYDFDMCNSNLFYMKHYDTICIEEISTYIDFITPTTKSKINYLEIATQAEVMLIELSKNEVIILNKLDELRKLVRKLDTELDLIYERKDDWEKTIKSLSVLAKS